MRRRPIAELAEAAGLELRGRRDICVETIAVDSRAVREGEFFVAVKGPNNDGHRYLEGAYERGCRAFLLSDRALGEAFFEKHDDICAIWCDNTEFGALELAAAYVRELDPIKVGVTGSTGKTSTRSLVGAVLSSRYRTVWTKKNLNTYVGISMTAFSAPEDTEAIVFEMGMDRKNEIYEYCKRIKPDTALITNVGTVHMEFIGSQEGIAREKLKITSFLRAEDFLIYNSDSPFLSDEDIDRLSEGSFRRFSAGEKEGSMLRIGGLEDRGLGGIAFDMELSPEGAALLKEAGRGSFEPCRVRCELPFMGLHNAHNGALAAACGLVYGIDLKQSAAALSGAEIEDKRLTAVRLKGGVTLVDDSYNANPDSVSSAIATMASLEAKRRIVVLARMGELGPAHEESHLRIGKLIADSGMDIAVLIGRDRDLYARGIMDSDRACGINCFPDVESAADFVKSIIREGDAVLVKGSLATNIHTLAEKLREELGQEN